ncbi:hypothetical protein JW935_18180 [candidate division KSB1 bacterium]|nr:hypothetical protein [candidate division KSB1 bacterium]
MRHLIFILGLACAVLTLTTAQADEVTSQIDKAKNLYSQGKLSEAVTELNFAINQIQSLQIDRYKTAFPNPPSGWEAEDFESGAAGMAFMGGGTSISRNYTKTDSDGETSVKIEVVSDSPLLSSLMMMISNPMFLGGKKVVSIGGEKAVEEWSDSDKSGQLQIVIENRMLITVSGNGLASKDALYTYANGMNINKLKSFLN